MIHYTHIKCDDCGKRHTPGNPTECIEGLSEEIADYREQIAVLTEKLGEQTAQIAINERDYETVRNLLIETRAQITALTAENERIF